MDPIVSQGVRAGSKVISSALSRYRPVGVARTGSSEDRAQAYRRLLDALTHVGLNATWFYKMREEAGKAAEPFLAELLPRLTESGNELACAVNGVRLCAPAYVIEAAETAARAMPGLDTPKGEFDAAYRAFVAAQGAFLDVARHDLGYEPKWYRVDRWWAERQFRKRQAQQRTA
ncbi:hypothetical protein [Streptomyces hyaluromycini]|uniref:hypothetical protein n=1 Tax=Streptomyces hyaluromycini TaxID=1377993 RepID=UPI001237FDBF|nr:hypothetical protein [Streptomyces hyaluromycini]